MSSATFISIDSGTKGTWKSPSQIYGVDGYDVITNATSWPSYATVTYTGTASFTWAASTSDARALQKPATPSDRIAACYFSTAGVVTIDINITDGNPHRVAIYVVDFDTSNRRQTIEVKDSVSSTVLDGPRASGAYDAGYWYIWSITGHVKIVLTNTGPQNAVVSGVFFDDTGALLPVGIPSEEAFGVASFTRQDGIYCDGIASAETFGTTSFGQTQDVTVTAGIASSEAFGTAALVDPTAAQTITVTAGIASEEAFGTSILVQGGVQSLIVTGIPSEEAIGTPSFSVVGATFQPLMVYLDGVAYPDVSMPSLSVTHRLNGQGSGDFKLIWKTQSTRPELFRFVKIIENYRVEFAGFVDAIDESLDQNSVQSFRVSCGDLWSVLDKRTVKGVTYHAGNVKQIVKQIVTDWLDGEYITSNNVTATVSTSRDFTFTGSVGSALVDLASDTGSVAYMDDFGDLHFETPGVTSPSAPESIPDAGGKYRDLVVSTSSKGYVTGVMAISDQNLG